MLGASTNEVTNMEWWRWDELNPEILALIFVRIILVVKMVRNVPFVCKGWLKVVAEPCCWSEVDLKVWCRHRCRDACSLAVDMVVEKLVQQSEFSVRRLCVTRMKDLGFFYVARCGNFLKVLEMPMSDITDQMVLKHVQRLPNLTILDVSHCLKITSKGLAAFGNQCESLLHLKRNKDLVTGYLSTTPPASEAEAEAKAVADTMPNLKHLELNFGHFSDLGLSEILTKCKLLFHLDILGCFQVQLEGDLAERCERLQHFGKPTLR